MNIKIRYISFTRDRYTRENQVNNDLLNKITEQEGKFAIKNVIKTIRQQLIEVQESGVIIDNKKIRI